ncbi:MarR family winged helix-turn-helix transcriptional regulator [Spirosoma arcticum]
MNTTLLKELIDLENAFEQQFPNPVDQQVANFSDWLCQQLPPKTPITETGAYGRNYLPPLPTLPTYIVQYLSMDYRYHKQHVKKALEGTPLITYDDFIYLVLLVMNGSMTKMSLVEANINEKASGMLVIKRLLDQEFVIQTNDLHDHRVRQMTITQKGRDMLAQVLPVMSQAMSLFVGHLSEREQAELADLLTKLDQFHNPLFLHDKNTSISELYEKLVTAERPVATPD